MHDRLAFFVCFWAVPALAASTGAEISPVVLDLDVASVGGTLLLPRQGRPFPCAVLIGGTLSQNRDGRLERPGVPERSALKRLAEALAAAGYGSFRYDQVGHGESRPKAGWKDLYEYDARVLAGIYQYLRGRPECHGLVAIGESAGAYVACLAARAGHLADAYVFLGAFAGKAEELFAYNYGRLADYADRSAENARWLRERGLEHYAVLGRRWPELFAAARKGELSFEIAAGNNRHRYALGRRREELDLPPEEMFAFIQRPALALAGTCDLNVPPHHAARAVAVMQRAGNLRSRFVLIEGADHSFQIAAPEPDQAFRERYSFESFRRPYHPQLDREMLAWLGQTLAPRVAAGDAQKPAPAPALRALHGPERDPATGVWPERLHLAPGVTVIENILDPLKAPGVDTLEGRIGPLLRAAQMRAHFIEMPGGLYVAEHPHAKGSIIYTVRGRWGLSSAGRWHLMGPGSLFWFDDGVPTGYQVPFQESAYILIFKAMPGEDDAAFAEYLRELAQGLEVEQRNGTPFRLADLPEDHPALEFARRVNPRLGEE